MAFEYIERFKKLGFGLFCHFGLYSTEGMGEWASCVYNVDIMEESTSIISCGAGGISKRVFSESGRIERQNIVKNIEQYLRDIEEIIIKKEGFFA